LQFPDASYFGQQFVYGRKIEIALEQRGDRAEVCVGIHQQRPGLLVNGASMRVDS
jgi:hypothetical protein